MPQGAFFGAFFVFKKPFTLYPQGIQQAEKCSFTEIGKTKVMNTP
jgi:hypothetical protein